MIRVERAYDEKARVVVVPKSRAGRRTVPIVGALRYELTAHKARQGRDAGLVFGSTADTPIVSSNVWRRAQVAWKRAGVDPIGLHEARHTFASVLIAAGVNAKAITTYMGHASIQATYDLYGKLMPGSEAEATHWSIRTSIGLTAVEGSISSTPGARTTSDQDPSGDEAGSVR